MERWNSKPPVSDKEEIPVKALISPVAYPLGALVLFGLYAAGITDFLPPGFRFLITSVVFFVWPGDVIARRFLEFRPADYAVRILSAFLCGLSTLALLAWILSLLAVSFSTFWVIAHGLVLGIIAIDFAYRVRNRRRAIVRSSCVSINRVEKRGGFAFLMIAVLIGTFFSFTDGKINPAGDALDHIGYARKIIAENTLTPAGVLAEAPEIASMTVKHDPRKGPFHPVIALWSKACRLDPASFWPYLPIILAPIAFLAFIEFCFALLPGLSYVLATMILFLVFQGGIGKEFFATIANGQNLSQVYLWALFAYSLSYLMYKRRTPLALIMILAAGGAVIHVGFLMQFILVIASLWLVWKYMHLDTERIEQLIAGILILTVIVLTWKMALSYQEANILHSHPEGLLCVSKGLFIVSPIEILRKYSLVFLGGIALIPGLFFIRHHSFQARLCIALSAIPVFICFNPLLAPLVFGKITYLLNRLVLNIPAFPIIVLVMGSLFSRVRTSRFASKVLAVLLIFMWAKLFLLPAANALPAALKSTSFSLHKFGPVLEFREAVEAASKKIPEESIVISDPVTSYALSAYVNVKVVTVLNQHGNPNDPLVLRRLVAARNVLSPYVTQHESLEYLKEFNVGYIVLNGAFSKPVEQYMAEWDPGFINVLKEKYGTLHTNISWIYASRQVLIFRVKNYENHGETWVPTVPFIQEHKIDWNACDSPIMRKGMSIKNFAIKPKQALPGETVRLSVMYEKNYRWVDRLPFLLIVRFDDKKYVSTFGSYPGNKLVRRMKERRGGFLSRLRVDHKIFNGLYTPEMWPLGYPVVEQFDVKLPSTLLEGTYDVELKLMPECILPNFFLRDFLYNDDKYAGTKYGELVVKNVLVR